ncbi:MAG: hypothetical protein Tsb0034_20730 [Ekhidna sp.]
MKLDQEDEFIISPVIGLDKNNHTWYAGPALLFSFGDQVEEREKLKFTGITLGYEHFLHGKNGKWNLFHSFDLVAQRVKDTQRSQYFDPNAGSFVSNNIEQIDQRIFLSANAGILLNLSDRIGITQSIGIGASAVFRKTESDFDSFTDNFFNQRWLLKTGLRYQIGN